MKRKLLSLALCVAMAATMLAGCAKDAKETSGGNDKLVVGFAQIGQESGWRDAETASIQFYAGQNIDTIELKFADAQQKQEIQIKAI